MSKRFTDTDLFKKRFIRGLQGAYKLLWIYVYHDCNHAGIWEIDFEIASIRIGLKVTAVDAEDQFKDKIILVDNNEKWFIPSFIEFQYGALNPNNRAHNSVIKILNKYGIDHNNINKGLARGLQGAMDMDMDKEVDKEEEGRKGIVLPHTEKFKKVWNNWLTYKREIKKPYKSNQSIQLKLDQLAKHDEDTAIKMINNAICNGWQGIFDLKIKTNDKPSRYHVGEQDYDEEL